MSEERNPLPGVVDLPPEEQPRLYTRREVRRRRVLFWLGIAAWVVVLLIPFFIVMLAVRGEFSVTLPGEAPDNQLRVWMVMEPRERGIAYSAPTVAAQDALELQVQTNVRYLLWEGENEALSYCTIYTRESADAEWQFAEGVEGVCGVAP